MTAVASRLLATHRHELLHLSMFYWAQTDFMTPNNDLLSLPCMSLHRSYGLAFCIRANRSQTDVYLVSHHSMGEMPRAFAWTRQSYSTFLDH
jgi:hypothetical protein